jgi:hypothetical protein
MADKDNEEKYPPDEAKRRLVAALRGARIAGHVPMKPKEQKAAKKAKPKKGPGK